MSNKIVKIMILTVNFQLLIINYLCLEGEKMKYLVTGGAGFIGANFVKYMLKKYKDIINKNSSKKILNTHIVFLTFRYPLLSSNILVDLN